jgi:hypothetical protein
MSNSSTLDAPEVIAREALELAKGHIDDALEATRAAVKLLARWKLLQVIEEPALIEAKNRRDHTR